MRIVQHKPATHKGSPPTADLEDCTGLTVIIIIVLFLALIRVCAQSGKSTFIISFQQQPNINTEVVSGAPVKGNADFSPEATQVAHAPKAPQIHAQPRNNAAHHINQPRK